MQDILSTIEILKNQLNEMYNSISLLIEENQVLNNTKNDLQQKIISLEEHLEQSKQITQKKYLDIQNANILLQLKLEEKDGIIHNLNEQLSEKHFIESLNTSKPKNKKRFSFKFLNLL